VFAYDRIDKIDLLVIKGFSYLRCQCRAWCCWYY